MTELSFLSELSL